MRAVRDLMPDSRRNDTKCCSDRCRINSRIAATETKSVLTGARRTAKSISFEPALTGWSSLSNQCHSALGSCSRAKHDSTVNDWLVRGERKALELVRMSKGT